MEVAIGHLYRHAHLTEAVARLIYGEFWKDVENGLTLDSLVAHLRNTGDPARIPLSLVALAGGRLAEARRLGFPSVYFGTDGPGFYTRLGAELHEQVTPEFCIMRFPLEA